ncbi:MAG: hypothetical protein JWQ89_3703 [Devosia sp.]|uniref:hypothetical protein n=1 Tax=Devosia sp. TaxID=1871048 RepID=UPI00260D62A5|nr:hypothetical protein [Devosia sp.]MDB5541976.1 hypothetical protein [Devosia sp.]
MSTDTPSGESGDLSIDGASAAFAALMEPIEAQDDAPQVDTEIDPPKEEDKEKKPEPNAAEEGDDAPITVMVDGKPVTLTKAEIAEAHKNGLRQSDYTQKTMALAEQRKTAEAETAKAQQERGVYAHNLTKMAAQLEGALQQQAQIDWNALLEQNPVEFLKQKHLFDQRQAALQQNQQEQTKVQQQFQTEAIIARQSRLSEQQHELLAKLPDWKDEAKADTEQKAIKEFLKSRGYRGAELNIDDHRAVLLARDAMMYHEMMDKAKAATKRVQNVPTKVERPGVSRETSPLDGRTAAMQRQQKTGSIEDTSKLFASLI